MPFSINTFGKFIKFTFNEDSSFHFKFFFITIGKSDFFLVEKVL